MTITNEERTNLVKEKFGQVLFSKANKFLASQMNIIKETEEPIDFRAIILDENNREFHIIVNNENLFIFHDCPYFLKQKICFHIVKSFLIMPINLAVKILDNFEQYNLISEDLGSTLKNEAYLIESDACFSQKKFVEGLNYIKKAYFNKRESKEIIAKYLKSSLKYNLLIEFFEFSELIVSEHHELVSKHVEKAFKKLIPTLNEYSLFDILKMIESIRYIFDYINIEFFLNFFDKCDEMIKGPNLNENYFSIYIIKNYSKKLGELNSKFKDCLKQEDLEKFQGKILDYFLKQIENFCLIDELKLLTKHFDLFNIEKSIYINAYNVYEEEINDLEKKVYLKKFAFLRILIERFKINKSSLNLQKKRNLYYVVHDPKNMNIPAYKYIIDHIGFNPINENVISSQEIGINYFIFKELFEDDFNKTDILYYKNQFWQDTEQTFTLQEGLTLLQDEAKRFDFIEYKTIDPDDTILIEWDLANSPQKGCLVNAYDARQIIPDPNNPLTPELKPFDLCFCKKEALSIEGNILKTIQLLHKCTFQEAIQAITRGTEFIERYFPLHLVKSVIEKEISPFDAYDIVNNNPNQSYIGNYENFKQAFNEFLFKFIKEHKDVIFSSIKANPEKSYDKLILLLNLQNLISGINYNFSRIMNDLLPKYDDLNSLKEAFFNEIHKFISQKIQENQPGSTIIFDIKKFQNTPFIKYIEDIVSIRKKEFEARTLKKSDDKYEFAPYFKTYYGKFFCKMLNIQKKQTTLLDDEEFKKIKDYCQKLGLKLNLN